MRLKLQTTIGQKQRLAPLQQQSLALLTLSTQALEQEVHEILESNPLIEEKLESAREEYDQVERDEDRSNSWEERRLINSDDNDYRDVGGDNGNDWADSSAGDQGHRIGNEWTGSVSRGTSFDQGQGSLEHLGAKESLHEYLNKEISFLKLNQKNRLIASIIVASINDDGWLGISIEEIRNSLPSEITVQQEEIETVLHLLQNLDPPGICARDLEECLLLQLERRDDKSTALTTAMAVVKDYLALFAKHKYGQLSRMLGVSTRDLVDASKIIRELDPKPGRQLDTTAVGYVIPDIIVRRVDDKWDVKLNPETEHRLQINQHYKQYMESGNDKNLQDYVRTRLKEADWFINSLNQRCATMLRVAQVITERQAGFMGQDHKELRPLMMTEIADELDIHDSTVSRAVSGKYMQTPHGVFAMRSFFPSQITTESGKGIASDAVQVLIKKIIDNEPLEKPLSDEKIAIQLKGKGINAARRTVTKYREQMNIPSSSERRQHRGL